MKRLAFLVVVLVAALVAAASAMAAPAPKATGDYGYSFGGVQRHVTFNAIQSSNDTCGTLWNVAGIQQFNFKLDGDPNGIYVHDVALAQNGQTVTGTGSHGVGTDYENHWHITAGSVVGNTLDLTWVYDSGPAGVPGLTHHMTGTIAANGSISGTWGDNYLGMTRTGTFTASAALPVASYCGKGTFAYDDANGNWYFAVVKSVKVEGGTAWYAAQILASNLGYESSATNYIFVKVSDVAEPGIGKDSTAGDLMTPAAALAAVAGKATPSSSALINAGNIQVH